MVLIDPLDYVISFECDDNPLFQEELSLGKKLNTNGDKVDQSGGRGGRVPSSINLEQSQADSMTRIQGPIIKGFGFQQDRPDVKSLDLGSTDSSWMEASGIITDSEEEDSHKEVLLEIMKPPMDLLSLSIISQRGAVEDNETSDGSKFRWTECELLPRQSCLA